MAHPYQPPPPVGDNVWRRMPSWHGRSSQPTSNHSDWIQSPNGMLSPVDDSRIITVDTEGEDIGFIIKGGAEQKMGIFVARVEPDSDAEMSGLQAGDQLLEVNNISFEVIPIHTASTVLRSSNRLKMKVVTPPKKTSHKDRKDGKWFESRGNVNASIDKERTVLIQLDEHHQFIGFNIRGGSEYGLGVFVSRTDPGGLAELNGIKPGDQILEVNGKKFDNITHAEAVEIIRNQRNMIMRVRSTNKVPTYPRIEDNLPPPPRSQSAVPLKGGSSSSPPSSYDGSVKSAPLPNKDWLVRNEPVNKGFSDEIKRPASTASSHSSKHSSKQIAPTGPSGVKEGHQDHRKERTPSGRNQNHLHEHPHPQRGDPPGSGKRKEESLGEKQRPMLDRDDVYHKREKKGKTLREMFFGTKSGHKNKTSMEAVEEEHDINKSRDGTKTDEELNESMGERKGRKGRGKMHGLLNSFRKTREDVKVKRRVPLQRDDSDADLDDSNLEASGQWATRKGTPGTPDKAEDIVPYGSIGKQRGLFVQGAGTQVMLASITAPSHHAMLEESAKKVLNPDESKAVLRHIKRYDEEGNIDALVVPLLAILDQPEKVLLLRDIRGFIAPKDIGRFDSLVSKKELEAMKLVRKQEKENQSSEGYNGPQRSQYSHIPTITAPLVAPEPIPVGPSEYVNIKTSEDSNLTRLRGKKVMISSNPEIIPRQDSYVTPQAPNSLPGRNQTRISPLVSQKLQSLPV
ncbi:putative whirlin-like [Apostichopus japonicus]|uniref:Putative whirlin-like n=1 Tax=Stichopus japonicus TaxID=307972 RepID=A0A2G8JBS7_STIJA|nr:putative whirlin-like [Apostichopus japonicus]